jgi:hypothetical protein
MAEETTFLQNWIFAKFVLPFLLIFFLIFAILERTKLFGEGKKQLNALVAFVIGLIFVGAIYPKLVVENMVLFLTVTLVCVFVVLLLWGFVFGDIKEGLKPTNWMKWVLGILIGVAFVVAVIFATGFNATLANFFSGSGTGQTVLTNAIFIIVIAVALVVVIRSSKGGEK